MKSKKKTTKRKSRKSIPLFAKIKLIKLKELIGDEDDTVVVVSRNFVLDTQRKIDEDKASKELFLEE